MNFEAKLELAIFIGLSSLAIGVGAVSYIKANREYKQTMAQIKIDNDLNAEALARTQETLRARIWDRSRPIPSVADLTRQFKEEYEFQKIAVRLK